MKIIDWYILKRYLGTFAMIIVLFAPIGIIINLSEKIDKILENEVPVNEVLVYYYHFTIYFAHMLFPLFLFLSVIFFTSKLANNTEIIAILSSGISFWRFVRPYIFGAIIVSLASFVLGMFLVPKASKGFNEFAYQYLKKGHQEREKTNLFRQINDNDFIYVSNFIPKNKTGFDFTLEHVENNQLIYKISATRIQFIEKDSLYRLSNYLLREIGPREDKLTSATFKDTLFTFDLEDLTPLEYVAETLNYKELNSFIALEKKRGSSNINRYLLVKYRRWSLPISTFILTIMAVAVSSMKRRGGMGVNLAIGIGVAFVYVFFDKIFGTMAEQSGFSPLMAVLIPNLSFGIVALYLLYYAKR
ncbi:MAG: LptF/LptG family permease [Flavobacteriaceae bacterium]|nr:LptF/LptG family permease [Flavobacteriaceae bacterium]